MPQQSKTEPRTPLIVKLSGEMLSTHDGKTGKPFFAPAVEFLLNEIESLAKIENIAIVIGGGNIARGRTIDPNNPTADFTGMEATRTNAIKLREELEKRGVKSHITDVKELSTAEGHLSVKKKSADGTVVILTGGSGWPGVSTDTAAVLLAYSLGARQILKATKVDGIYSRPPEEPGATLLARLTAQEFIDRRLNTIFDPVGMTLARDKNISIHFFNGFTKGNFALATTQNIGSFVSPT